MMKVRRSRRGLYAGGTVGSYTLSIGAVVLATFVCLVLDRRLDSANLIMVYLLAVAIVASKFGLGEAIMTSLLSVSVFNLAFVEPRGSFSVAAPQHWVTFLVMLLVALLISGLHLRVRLQAKESLERERLTGALYQLSKELLQKREETELARATAQAIQSVFEADAGVALSEDGVLATASESETGFEEDEAMARCLKENRSLGKGTELMDGAKGVYLPVRGSGGAIGVLAVCPGIAPSPGQVSLFQTFANTLGLAIERAGFARQSQEAKVATESERMRNALLSSISHDLRTPLTAIAGAASSLKLGRGDAESLAATIYDQTLHMNIQVQNLLDMTRLRSGEIEPNLEWHLIEEIIGSAIARSSDMLGGRTVKVCLANDLPLLRVDASLLDKVFVNLLENVATHARSATEIVITSDVMSDTIRINLADNGPGIPKGEESRIFERFTQPRAVRGEGGYGLGLAISRAIMRLHGGRLWAENAPTGGAVFHIELPKPTTQPEMPLG
jgi:two-component system sensor histidine kinase KdpD